MRAVLLLRRRVIVAEDAFAEVVIWQVPLPVAPSKHEFKYRLAYVVQGKCRYAFSSPEQLMADFEADIARWNYEQGRT